MSILSWLLNWSEWAKLNEACNTGLDSLEFKYRTSLITSSVAFSLLKIGLKNSPAFSDIP